MDEKQAVDGLSNGNEGVSSNDEHEGRGRVPKEVEAEPHVHMDAMAFGMGCCCLQVTFQVRWIFVLNSVLECDSFLSLCRNRLRLSFLWGAGRGERTGGYVAGTLLKYASFFHPNAASLCLWSNTCMCVCVI